jgi:hypothetical protein
MEGPRYVAISNPVPISYSRNVGCDEPKCERKDNPGGRSSGRTKAFLAAGSPAVGGLRRVWDEQVESVQRDHIQSG